MKKNKRDETIEKRKAAVLDMIDDAILTVKNDIKMSSNAHKIAILIKIEHELNNMKKYMSPSIYLPWYNYIIVDCWDEFSDIGEKLLHVLQEYKEKLV